MNDNEDRKKLIAEGAQKPGAEGAFWRLMERLDVDAAVPGWVAGERIRGTSPEHMLQALAEIMAAAAIQGIGVFGRKGIERASRDLMIQVSSHLGERVTEALSPPKTSVIRLIKD